MSEKICKNCAAFRADGYLDGGDCRINPPIFHDAGDGLFNRAFPDVAENDWCMKFVPKEVIEAEFK
jgi:hypothetical protein